MAHISARFTPRRAALVAVIVSTSLAAGCGGSDGPSAPTQGTVQDLVALIATLVPPQFVVPSNAEPGASLLATMNVEGQTQAFAALQNGSNLVSGGDVWSSGRGAADPPSTPEVQLDVRSTPVNSVRQYVYSTLPSHPASIVLAFDGTVQHRFRITGSGAYPARTDSVPSVTPVTPATPSSGANVPRALGLSTTWTAAGTDTSVYVGAMVYMNSDPTQRRLSGVVRDVDEQLTISGSTLSALPAGDATLVVVRFRLRYVGSGAFRTGLLSEAGDARPILLQ